MRSIYLEPSVDARLRQLAFELKVTKSALIRAAVTGRLADWSKMDPRAILAEIAKEEGGPG